MGRKIPLVLIIFALALLVRMWNLNQFPPGLWFDEGLKGVDAWEAIHGGGFRLIYPDVFPREPLFVWYLAIVEWLAGPRVIPLRLSVTLLGALTCCLLFLVVRATEPQKGVRLALAAGVVMAALHWNAHFSRLLFRTNLVPLVALSSVLGLTWASRQLAPGLSRWWRWFAAGAVGGLGFYTYLSWWFFLPVVGVWLWALTARKKEKEDTAGKLQPSRNWLIRNAPLMAFALGMAAVFLPLGVHYVHFPEHLLGRPGEISPFRRGWGEGLQEVGRNALYVAGMFSFRGDHVPKHNVPWSPVLDPVWSIFFYGGIAAALWRICTSGGFRKVETAWLAWIFFMSLPSIFSKTDSANMLRNLGATPAACYFVAAGWHDAMRWAARRSGAAWLRWGLVLALLWGCGFQMHKLWIRHPLAEGVQGNFSVPYAAMAELCEPDAGGALLFVPTDIYAHKTFEFLTLGRNDIHPLQLSEAISRRPGASQADQRILCTMWSASPSNPKGNLGLLQAQFPQGAPERESLQMGSQPFARVFRIPSDALLSPEEAQATAARLEQSGFFSDR